MVSWRGAAMRLVHDRILGPIMPILPPHSAIALLAAEAAAIDLPVK